ncbi:hypothetical protein MHTCC0001_09720 [Flavobacteriaceae bacterium MHTCC 0001]
MKQNHTLIQPRQGKQDIFRVSQVGRKNFLFEFITDFLFTLSSYPSYVVEVLFLRRKFGERYFTTATAFVISVTLIVVWFAFGEDMKEFLGILWLPFVAVFLIQAIRHRLEISKYGTTYNFDRYSYSDGEIHPLWWRIIGKKVLGVTITRYRVHIFLEPLAPYIIGLVLTLVPATRGIGVLICNCAFFFGFRNFMKAHFARGCVLDIIDEQLTNRWKHDVLVEEKPKSETKGLSLPIELPETRETREGISKSIENDNLLDIWDDGIGEKELGVV